MRSLPACKSIVRRLGPALGWRRSLVVLGAAASLALVGTLRAPTAWAHGAAGPGLPPPPMPAPPKPKPPPPPPPPVTAPSPVDPGTPPPPPPVGAPGGPITGPQNGPAPVGAPGGTTPSPTPTTSPPTQPAPPTTGGPGQRTDPAPGAPTPATGPAARGRRRAATNSTPGWLVYWRFNRWAYLPDRAEIDARRAANITPRAGVPVTEVGAAARRRVAQHTLLPHLLKTLLTKPPAPDEVVAAALIALAKLDHSASTIALLASYVEDPKQAAVVRESAAIAMGMLRRTKTDARMCPEHTDDVRASLFRLVDDAGDSWRVRSFALLSIGVLGDQPGAGPLGERGVVVARQLWQRLMARSENAEVTIAFLTALGLQPSAAITGPMQNGLRGIVLGRRIARRTWTNIERAHALTTLVRLEVPGWSGWVLRSMAGRRSPKVVRQAAFLALGANAHRLDSEDRSTAADAWARAAARCKDSHTKGLMHIAAGRLIAADIEAGSSHLALHPILGGRLLSEARGGSPEVRAYAGLGLAFALRPQPTPRDGRLMGFRAAGLRHLERGLDRAAGGAPFRGAFAAALGVLRSTTAADAMHGLLTNRNALPDLRGHCAIALGSANMRKPEIRKAIAAALWDKRSPELRTEAALALSMLPRGFEGPLLVTELGKGGSQWVQAQIAAALGQLGDLRVVDALIAHSNDRKRSDEARALAIASLGRLLDPEPRPSMARLGTDVNYPARSHTLHEALGIL